MGRCTVHDQFSSGSYTEGSIAAKAAVEYIKDLGKDGPEFSEEEYENPKTVVFKPTNEPLLTRGRELLGMLGEDMENIGAEDLHQLMRAWELKHWLIASESVTHHTLFREETRWPGYYYRGDHMNLDDNDWHRFTLSTYHRDTGEWEMEKAPVYHIID